MHCSGGYVTALTGVIGLTPPAHGKRHLALQNNVRRFDRMGMVGITRVRSILPNVSMAEAFALQLFFELRSVHRCQAAPKGMILFARHEHTRGDARYQAAWREPLCFDTEPV